MQYIKKLSVFPRDNLLEQEPFIKMAYHGEPIEKFLDANLEKNNSCVAKLDKYYYVYTMFDTLSLEKIVMLSDRSVFSYSTRQSYENLGVFLDRRKIKAQYYMEKSEPKIMTFEFK